MASYYRWFIPGFAKIAAPLHALTSAVLLVNGLSGSLHAVEGFVGVPSCIGLRAGSREGAGGGGGAGPPPPNPENQFENRAKFLCLKGKVRAISLFLHQKCFNVNSSGHKEPQNRNFQPPHAC